MDKLIEMFTLTGNPWWDVPLLLGCVFLGIAITLNR